MGVIGFDSGNLEGISQSLQSASEKVSGIGGDIAQSIANIRNNWTGDEENLAGRERDLEEIQNNLETIRKNIATIAKFLDEKNIDFKKINYK